VQLPRARRFLEDVLHLEPGVEAVARAHVDLESDPELVDHAPRGTILFPTVFGLEAMAQAAAYALGERELGSVRIESIRLDRPIVVDGHAGTTIEVRAEVQEQVEPGSPRQVRTAIGAEATGFAVDHFSATFVLDTIVEPASEPYDLPATPLDLRPEEDVYGWLLFHGPAFRRIEQVHRLDSTGCVFSARATVDDADAYLLGDPFFRDALLQAPQLVVPQSICLPIEIGSIEIATTPAAGTELGVVVYEGKHGGHEHARVVAFDADDRVRERITGFRSRIVETRDDNPTAKELADPQDRDARLVQRELAERGLTLGVRTPEVALAHMRGLHALSADERRVLELPLFEDAVGRLLQNGNER
jgi:enediyne polyketide synthase